MILQPLCSDGIFTTTYASGVEVLFCAAFLGEPRRGLCHLHPHGMWDNGTSPPEVSGNRPLALQKHQWSLPGPKRDGNGERSWA